MTDDRPCLAFVESRVAGLERAAEAPPVAVLVDAPLVIAGTLYRAAYDAGSDRLVLQTEAEWRRGLHAARTALLRRLPAAVRTRGDIA